MTAPTRGKPLGKRGKASVEELPTAPQNERPGDEPTDLSAVESPYVETSGEDVADPPKVELPKDFFAGTLEDAAFDSATSAPARPHTREIAVIPEIDILWLTGRALAIHEAAMKNERVYTNKHGDECVVPQKDFRSALSSIEFLARLHGWLTPSGAKSPPTTPGEETPELTRGRVLDAIAAHPEMRAEMVRRLEGKK